MFSFKNWRRLRRQHKERIRNLVDMVQRAKILKGWDNGGFLNIDIPGTHLLVPSSIALGRVWETSARLYHKIDGTKVKIGCEGLFGFHDTTRTEDDPSVRRLLDLAYDYVWATILLAEKEKRESDERYARLRKEAISNMIAYDDAQPKPLTGGGLTAF